MHTEFIDLTEENLPNEHLCCIIRSKKPHPGIEAKRNWLAARLKEGHVFRKLAVKGCVFIEYAPLEKAWTPIEGANYLYIYCLWVQGAPRGHGYARRLLEYCLADARAQGRSGVCMLGARTALPPLSTSIMRTLCTRGKIKTLGALPPTPPQGDSVPLTPVAQEHKDRGALPHHPGRGAPPAPVMANAYACVCGYRFGIR